MFPFVLSDLGLEGQDLVPSEEYGCKSSSAITMGGEEAGISCAGEDTSVSQPVSQ